MLAVAKNCLQRALGASMAVMILCHAANAGPSPCHDRQIPELQYMKASALAQEYCWAETTGSIHAASAREFGAIGAPGEAVSYFDAAIACEQLQKRILLVLAKDHGIESVKCCDGKPCAPVADR